MENPPFEDGIFACIWLIFMVHNVGNHAIYIEERTSSLNIQVTKETRGNKNASVEPRVTS